MKKYFTTFVKSSDGYKIPSVKSLFPTLFHKRGYRVTCTSGRFPGDQIFPVRETFRSSSQFFYKAFPPEQQRLLVIRFFGQITTFLIIGLQIKQLYTATGNVPDIFHLAICKKMGAFFIHIIMFCTFRAFFGIKHQVMGTFAVDIAARGCVIGSFQQRDKTFAVHTGRDRQAGKIQDSGHQIMPACRTASRGAVRNIRSHEHQRNMGCQEGRWGIHSGQAA